MRQMTFTSIGFQAHHKQTKRERFLSEMELVVPWRELCSLIEPHYPSGQRGRPPIGIERMLRIYFLQQWFNLSDPQAEDCLYDSDAMRKFVGIDLGAEASPDETTICKFRHLIEENGIGKQIFASVNEHLKAQGIKIGNGTIVDATIITAPSSTKNNDKERDPEMHQTKKGNQWYFGMKGHIGVDSKEKIIHSIDVTPANVHDSQLITELLHGGETKVWGDSAYQGQKEAIRKAAPKASDMTNKRGARYKPLSDVDRSKNRTKSKVRSRVEHPFLIIQYILKHWHAFTLFLTDGRVCLLNNAAERGLRGIALGRKLWLFCGSDRGGTRDAAMYSLIVTAKMNDVDPQAWLADVLALFADHPMNTLQSGTLQSRCGFRLPYPLVKCRTCVRLNWMGMDVEGTLTPELF